LAKLALYEANFLLLDEPTNHLDLPTQEVLQEALQTYTGTVLFVTHDRYLVEQLATQIWVVDNGRLTVHKGDYQSYLSGTVALIV
jgi:ATP-binding cassette subfamily F protein 3